MSNAPDYDSFCGALSQFDARAAEIASADAIPAELRQLLADAGALHLSTPSQYGGSSLSLTEMLPYLEAAGRGHPAARMLVHVSNGLWRCLDQYGDRSQRELIRRIGAGSAVLALGITEREAGGGRDLRSLARRSNGGWLLSGEKHLITWATQATHFLLLVATDERRAVDSYSMFLVPAQTPGLVVEAQPTMGLAGIGLGSLRFDDLAADAASVVGELGAGLTVASSFLDYSRISLTACMVGSARRALDEAIAFAKRRVTFDKPVAERQAVQVHLADMYADISAASALMTEAAARWDAGEAVGTLSATAKLFGAGMVMRVTDLALRIHGGWGYTKEAAIERIYRDARAFWFEEGTAEVQQLLIARQLLR